MNSGDPKMIGLLLFYFITGINLNGKKWRSKRFK